MKFLIFLLWIIFYFIFFLFSLQNLRYSSIIWNIYIEAHVYIVISLLFIVTLFLSRPNRTLYNPIYREEESNFNMSIQKKDIIWFVKTFFSQIIYALAIFLFYVGIFLLFQVFLGEINIPLIFLLFNTLVLALFFFEHKFSVFQDFLRINTGIISAYYIFLHLYYILWSNLIFVSLDFINILLLAVLFYCFLQTERKSHYKSLMQSYIIAFIFLEFLVACKYFFWFQALLFSIISFFFSLTFFIGSIPLKNIFKINISVSRIWGLIFSYFFLIFSTFSFFYSWNDIIFISLFSAIIWYILYIFHTKFQNYVSLFGSSYAIFVSVVSLYLFILSPDVSKKYSVFFLGVLSLLYLIFDVISKKPYSFDTYFFHIFSLLVNLSWVISFFLFIDFSILNVALLLLWESLYFFYSYFSLRKTYKKWFITS